uniref:Cytochrome P450 n=1 Tax=Thermosporothrix sp. COM3 TaxID=2490863 RepID=A0A455SG44_9CHLR|nr:cytochrome P450 [Thermosporothrix sp. COM3]
MTQQINLISPAFKANPFPVFAMLRAQAPVMEYVWPDGQRRSWLITGFKEAEAALKDPRIVKTVRSVYSQEELAEKFPWVLNQTEEQLMLNRHMLNADPPDHTRLRTLVNLSFTPRLVEQWRSRIQEIADELLDAVQERGEMDVIDDLAFPLPIRVISEMLGVPDEDRTKFRYWSNIIVEATGDPQAFERAADDITAFTRYVHDLVEKKRNDESDDLLSKLIRAESEGQKLSKHELVAMVFLLIVAGHETTVNLVGNGIYALLQHPEQLELLKQHPEHIKTAVEEFLRYYSPVMTATQRWAREDMELGGQQIKRGDNVLIVLAAANHDEHEFAEPDKLDITRKENHHLAFGKGIHYCLGAPLARLEAQIAVNTLLKRMPNVRLAVDPQQVQWRPGILLLGLSKLPVTF